MGCGLPRGKAKRLLTERHDAHYTKEGANKTSNEHLNSMPFADVNLQGGQGGTESDKPDRQKTPGKHKENSHFPGVLEGVGDRTRTGDNQIHSLETPEHNPLADTTCAAEPLAPGRAIYQTARPDPDLARILDAWPDLSAPIRAAMLALVASACAAHRAP